MQPKLKDHKTDIKLSKKKKKSRQTKPKVQGSRYLYCNCHLTHIVDKFCHTVTNNLRVKKIWKSIQLQVLQKVMKSLHSNLFFELFFIHMNAGLRKAGSTLLCLEGATHYFCRTRWPAHARWNIYIFQLVLSLAMWSSITETLSSGYHQRSEPLRFSLVHMWTVGWL